MIFWDENKNKKLKLERNITFEQISEIIIKDKFIDILEHKKRKNQKIFIIELKEYIYAVPFVIDNQENIILKTAYPSRKLNKIYRG